MKVSELKQVFREELKPSKNIKTIKLTVSSVGLKRFKTVPTYQNILAPGQLKNLKEGENILNVNHYIFSKLQRMQSDGIFSIEEVDMQNEANVTGTGAGFTAGEGEQYATPAAFGSMSKKAKKTLTQDGYKEIKRPKHPSHTKLFDFLQQ